VLGLAVLLWSAGFDIIYACQDFAFDREAQLRSIPARLGVRGALRVAAASHLLMLVALAFVPRAFAWGGLECPLTGIYHAGVAAVAALLVWEHALVRPHDLSRVNRAFFQVNAMISFGLFAVVVIDTLV
jgi:4-hydroxybenzoate polyprenyltransferase